MIGLSPSNLTKNSEGDGAIDGINDGKPDGLFVLRSLGDSDGALVGVTLDNDAWTIDGAADGINRGALQIVMQVFLHFSMIRIPS